MSRKSKLQRKRHPMPEFVEKALEESSLMKTYRLRPAYQQNDYIGWINSAKREDTKQKRLQQMIDELNHGGVYMKMEHKPSKRT